MDGSLAVIGAPSEVAEGVDSGVAYVYRFSDGAWNEEARLAPSDKISNDRFGFGVAVRGNKICVLAPLKSNEFGNVAGAAYVFESIGGAWIEVGRLTPLFETIGNSCAIGPDAIALTGFGAAGRGIRIFPASATIFADDFE